MRVIDNGRALNRATDPPTGYDGHIGIEVRGATSQTFPKKQYALETREADGSNRNVPLLGLPRENDWILHAPYTDKTLVRNAVAYRLARSMGRYASRTRFCEVVLNGEYQGVYLLLEKIKRDDARVDIARLRPDETSGDDLTGGYIVKVDKAAGGQYGGWFSPFPPPYPHGRQIRWEFHDPSPREIVPEQAAYVQASITALERALAGDDYADPERGFPPARRPGLVCGRRDPQRGDEKHRRLPREHVPPQGQRQRRRPLAGGAGVGLQPRDGQRELWRWGQPPRLPV